MQFNDVKGHLALVDPTKQRPFKFCGLCGHKIQAEDRKLRNHLQGQHNGQQADWLKFLATPTLVTEPDLWQQFKEDPSADFLPSAPGRPRKREQKHEQKAKKVRFAEDV